MTETRTTRFGLPQWSSGGDSPSRSDFNEAFGNTEARAAYDDGGNVTSLPTSGINAGRYVMLTEGSYRTLYRASGQDGSWEQVGGNRMPTIMHYRPVSGSSAATTDTTWQVSHASLAQPSASMAYDGSLSAGGRMAVWDSNDAAKGTLHVGSTAAAAPGTLGRLYVRTRNDADLGIVVQPHSASAGNLLSVREPAGQDIITADSTGRLRVRSLSGFGGGSITSTASVTIAPTSAADSITTGLLLQGQSGAASKSLMQATPDSSDTVPIADIARDSIKLGRLPWGTDTAGGNVTVAGRQFVSRTLGYTNDGTYFAFRRADATTPTNTALDQQILAGGAQGLSSNLPFYMSQRYDVAKPTLTLYRFSNFSQRFLEASRAVDNGDGSQTNTLAFAWESDGRLRSGAWWKGNGTVRDARQSVQHCSRKVWAAPGVHYNTGQFVAHGGSFTYTWPTMTARSVGAFDLEVATIMELITFGSTSAEDAQWVRLETQISVDGGAWTSVNISENAPLAVGASTGNRPGGDLAPFVHRMTGVGSAGNSFTLRTIVSVGPSLIDIRLRSLDLTASECLIENYTAL